MISLSAEKILYLTATLEIIEVISPGFIRGHVPAIDDDDNDGSDEEEVEDDMKQHAKIRTMMKSTTAYDDLLRASSHGAIERVAASILI